MDRTVRILSCLAVFAVSGYGALVYETQAQCSAYPFSVYGSVAAFCPERSTPFSSATIDFDREYTDSVSIRLRAAGFTDYIPGPGGGVFSRGTSDARFTGDYIFTATSGSSGGWISPCVVLLTGDPNQGSGAFARAAIGAVDLSFAYGQHTPYEGLCLPPRDIAIHFEIGVPVTFTISLEAGSGGGVRLRSSSDAWADLTRLQFYDNAFSGPRTDVHYTLVQADLPEPSTAWLSGVGSLLLAGALGRARLRRQRKPNRPPQSI